MSATLMLHAGGREVNRDELTQFILPPATGTWKPIAHATVLDTAIATLGEAGYQIGKMRLAIAAEGQRFFGTLDLKTPLTPDGTVALAVGLRNSTDQTFPMGFCAGSRVFVCDNLVQRQRGNLGFH